MWAAAVDRRGGAEVNRRIPIRPRLVPRLRFAFGRDTTLGTFLERLAAVHGRRPFVEQHPGAVTLTYEEAAERVACLAGGIRSKLGRVSPGARIVIHVENGADVFLLALAACRAGGIAVPLTALATPDEVAQVASDSGAALVVHSSAEVFGEALPIAAPAAPGDVAAIFFTSGTTGGPKGAELTHQALLGSWRLGPLYPNGVRRDEIVCGLPIAHIAGFTIMTLAASLGVPVYLLERFRPLDALDAIESRRATVFVGVPAMYRMMDEAGAERRDLRSVRMWASGGDTMPEELARRFRGFGAAATCPVVGSLGNAVFVDGYGMAELAGLAGIKVALPMGTLPLLPLPGSSLKVVDAHGQEVRVGQVGELAVRGRGVLEGYHDRPDETAAVLSDGWLRTGDLARRLPVGVALSGRSKEVIQRGGYSVFPAEVERGLEQHPAVAEAAVVGLPDQRLGEVPVAALRLRPGASLEENTIGSWARHHLAAYKVPVRFLVVDDLPRTGPEKVRREAVRRLFDT